MKKKIFGDRKVEILKKFENHCAISFPQLKFWIFPILDNDVASKFFFAETLTTNFTRAVTEQNWKWYQDSLIY